MWQLFCFLCGGLAVGGSLGALLVWGYGDRLVEAKRVQDKLLDLRECQLEAVERIASGTETDGVVRRLEENRASIVSLVRAVDGVAAIARQAQRMQSDNLEVIRSEIAKLEEIATRAKYVKAEGGTATGWSRSRVVRFHGAATALKDGGLSVMIAAPNRPVLAEYLERVGIVGHDPEAFGDITITKRGES